MHTRLKPLLPALALGLLIVGCGPDDPAPAEWTEVLTGYDAALLGIWGEGDDVWAVGSDDGSGPAVLHYDGVAWERVSTGASGDLWWVSGVAGGDVWAAGEAGLVLRIRNGAVTSVPGVDAGTHLFGVFPLADGNVWAVGGAAGGGSLWHLDGDTFVGVDVPNDVAEAGAFFKAWGRSADDIWVVGLGGFALHGGVSGWSVVDVPHGRRLFTVHGNADTTLAVGGFIDGLVVAAQGAALAEVTPQAAPQFNGVWVTPAGDAVAVGPQGAVWRLVDGVWSEDETAPPTARDWHAVYVDPDGGVWTVGGFVVAPPLSDGMLAYHGTSAPPTP